MLTEKLGFDEERSRAAFELLAQVATERPGPPVRAKALPGDSADDAVLACAVEAGVDVLATGDRKHLLPIREHQGVRVLTPQAVLASVSLQDRLTESHVVHAKARAPVTASAEGRGLPPPSGSPRPTARTLVTSGRPAVYIMKF